MSERKKPSPRPKQQPSGKKPPRKKPPKKSNSWNDSEFKRNSSGKRGSREQWAKAATLLLKKHGQTSDYLALLGVTELPGSIRELKQAYKKTMLKAHPDQGGTEELAAKVIDAYENLLALMDK